jgi:D-alanyl-lipoteichoic acid acyltransferase DltB (MBOAT superfamily)
MTFTSLQFYAFLPIVYLVFYFTADRWRWLVLLVASYGFYASFKAPYLLAVLLMVTWISYACGLRIASYQDETSRKKWLQIGVVACVAILALLKYIPFLETQTNNLFGLSSSFSKTIISIGVSYFAFQAISYLADIYLEIEEPEKHFGRYALYMAFFPKLLQGPIERAGDLLPQLNQPYKFDYDAMRSGMLLFTWGLFKKVVVADRFALYADQVFNNVHSYTGLPLIIGTYAYAFQIFFDFSAYTDMARGVGRMFGINLTENFNSPYLSTSIADFWRRWHISFSRWILDYIFKPLQLGWRHWGQAGTALALIITFIISGIWHGASWGFVIWGVLHGIYLAASIYYKPFQKRLHKMIGTEKSRLLKWWQIIVTFNLVSFAWIFFRAPTVNDAIYVVNNFYRLTNNIQLYSQVGLHRFIKGNVMLENSMTETIILLVFVLVLILVSLFRHVQIYNVNFKYYRYRWMFYYVLTLSILFYGCFNKNTQFIYVQF